MKRKKLGKYHEVWENHGTSTVEVAGKKENHQSQFQNVFFFPACHVTFRLR